MKTIKLKDILSIAGKGGLYRFVAQARNGIVVESIEDGKRHVAPTTARVSSLEDIAIFTHEEEVPLSDVFQRIYSRSEGKGTLSHKDPPEEQKKFFQELVPGYDEERVYLSDIKKVFQWYNQLHSHDMLEEIEAEKPEDEDPEKSKATKTVAQQERSGTREPSKGGEKISKSGTGKSKIESTKSGQSKMGKSIIQSQKSK